VSVIEPVLEWDDGGNDNIIDGLWVSDDER